MKTRLFKQSIVVVLLVSMLLVITACGKKNEGEEATIHAVTGGSPAPYVTVEEDGTYSGYDIEVLQAVFERLPQYKLDLQTAEFESIFTGLTAGNYQLAVNNFSYREERSESYIFHSLMMRLHMSLYNEKVMSH